MSIASEVPVPRAPAWRTWSLRVAPYAVTAAVVAALLHRYPAGEIAQEMGEGHALRMLPLGLALPFAVWVQYAACDRVVLQAAVGPLALRDVLRAKAATALLLTLGYVVGGGGYGVWVARTRRVGAARAAGAVLYVMTSDLVAVCAVASAAMWLGGPAGRIPLRAVATWICAIQVLLILVGPYRFRTMRLPAVFDPWMLVPRGRSLAQILVRATNIAIISALTWGAMRAFGIEVPPGAAAMYLPMITLATALPINVAGLGVAQAAWLLFLPWASGPRLLAFQMLWQLFVALGLFLRGIPFLRGVMREIEEGRA